jgi:hypothetical protein
MHTSQHDEDAATPAPGRTTVVVLYAHPLLGEGLARLLSDEPGLDVTSVRTVDMLAAEHPLSPAPDVIILERSEPDHALDVLRFAPDALVIDVSLDPGPTFSYHRTQISTRPEGLLGAIREVRRVGHAGLAGAAAVESPTSS